jgi:hypothetical protein
VKPSWLYPFAMGLFDEGRRVRKKRKEKKRKEKKRKGHKDTPTRSLALFSVLPACLSVSSS